MPEPPTSPVPGDRKFDDPRGAASSRQAAPVDTGEEIRAAVRRVFAPHLIGPEAPGKNLWQTWRATLRSLLPLGAVSMGNHVRVLSDGDEVYRRMWRAIEEAQWEVLMSTYILQPDSVGLRTLQRLSQAARRGCRVTLVFDDYGSSSLQPDELHELRSAGGHVHVFNPVWRWSRPLAFWVRNHQKILVVDNQIGFAGGMNVGCAYAGDELGSNLFRDTHLVLEGPCVPTLARMVLGAMEDDEVRRARSAEVLARPDPAPREDGCLVQILESNLRRHQRAIQRALRTTIRHSVNRCYLCSAYFVPPWRLRRTIKRAARRGVDVRILTAGISDVPAVRMASQHLYGDLLRAGVRIFELQNKALHAKTMTVDGVYAAVGSFNLDYFSDRRNMEVNVSFLDVEMAGEVEAQFHEDLEHAREIKHSEWRRRTIWQRLLHRIAYLLLSI